MRTAWAGLIGLLFSGAAHADPGRLVIAGGAVSQDNAQVHGAFLAHLGREGRVAVIPAASGEPALSAQSYVETLAAHGVSADRIDIVHLAVVDDPNSADVDESSWIGNASAVLEIEKIEGADAIWFTGGDQVRVAEALLTSDGAATPMLSVIRRQLAAGVTVGGTSAGAAIMGETMIARGESLAALTEPLITGDDPQSAMDGGALMLSRGLGFLGLGIVDQHFDRKARLGRLARALAELPQDQRIGFGVDEDTALVVDLAENAAFVAGAGSVTILDARGARTQTRRGRFSISSLTLSLMAPGDRVGFSDFAVTPAASRMRIEAHGGYYDHDAQSGAGMAIPNERLEDALGVELLDNRASARLERVSFNHEGAGVRYVFEETAQSWAAHGNDAAGAGRYTIVGVSFSIAPVRVQIRTIPR